MNVITMPRNYTVIYQKHDKELQALTDVNEEMIPALVPSATDERIELNGTLYSIEKIVRKICTDKSCINITIEVHLY